jgi:ABC-type transport system involved in cytochrome c biogenesis permease subunit
MRQARQQFQAVRAAYLRNSAPDFNQASAAFRGAVAQLGPQLGAYPRSSKIRLEVVYNHVAPFRIAWILTAVSFLSLLLSWATRGKPFHLAGWASFVAGTVAMLAGFGMRVAISGRAPVANMYESVVYVGFGVAALGIVLELVCRRRLILTAAAGVATIALVLADNCPAVLDASLQPLQPVLRSNFWLVAHVLTITLSYAALALTLGIGNVTLGYFLAGSEDSTTIRSLTDSTYRTLQIGVLLLAAGTILGAVWADYSWGRFWGWDPKEVWALVALLGYLSVLHARSAGWVREFGLAALSVMCFALVVMAWYGVNFVLGSGLHSYGFGGGGQTYVFSAIAVQGLYVATAGVRYVVSGAAAEAHRAASPRAVSPAASTMSGGPSLRGPPYRFPSAAGGPRRLGPPYGDQDSHSVQARRSVGREDLAHPTGKSASRESRYLLPSATGSNPAAQAVPRRNSSPTAGVLNAFTSWPSTL